MTASDRSSMTLGSIVQLTDNGVEQRMDVMGHVSTRFAAVSNQQMEDGIRRKLIELGWTPPVELDAQPAPPADVARGEYTLETMYGLNAVSYALTEMAMQGDHLVRLRHAKSIMKQVHLLATEPRLAAGQQCRAEGVVVDEAAARRLDDYLGGEFDIRIGKQAAHAALTAALRGEGGHG